MYKDTHIDHIIEASKNNRLILFVGAGISKDSGYPLWGKFIKSFADELYGKDKNYKFDYLKIPQYYYNTFGKIKYEDKILESFNKHNARPNPIHKQIDRISPKHIITTNYDTLIEDQLNSGILKYEVIKKDSDVPNSKLGNYIIKMHGDINERNFVLKEDDYYNYNNDFSVISHLIQSLIVNNTLLFIGYSLSDTTFNSIYRLISNQLGNNVNNAYLFTTDNLNEFEVRYYDNLNIKVIGGESTKTKLKYGLSEKGLRTYEFLKCISNGIKSYYDIYKEIEPFNTLKFIEYKDLINYGFDNDEHKYLMELPPFGFGINGETPPEIDKSTKINLKEFLISKTDALYLFNEELNDNRKHDKNTDFNTAYKLYDQGDYKSAEEELEMLANNFLKNKDYIGYLIALFNIDNINNKRGSESSKDKNLEDYYLGDNFGQVLDNILRLSTNKDRKVILFLRDEIFNFRYLYRKQRRIYDIYQNIKLDWFKSHNRLNSYSHYDSNIKNIQNEFTSLNKFIDCNVIFIRHYSEFRSIVNIYFEALIYSHTLSKLDNDKMYFSSIYDNFNKEDVIYVFRYVDRKYFREFFKENKINKLKITDDAYDYLINEILNLIYLFNENSINLRQLYYLNNYIFSLSYIDLNDPNRLIEVLQSMQVFNTYTLEINKILLKLIYINLENISFAEYTKIVDTLSNNLNLIYINDKTNFKIGYSKYGNYINNSISILNYINKFKTIKVEVNMSELNKDIYLIKSGLKNIKELEKIDLIFGGLINYFNQDILSVIEELLLEYSQSHIDDCDILFISLIILNDYDIFNKYKDDVYNQLITYSNFTTPEGIIIENFNKNLSINRLYRHFVHKDFDKEDIINDINFKSVEGVDFQFDWFILENYSIKSIDNILHRVDLEYFKNNYIKDRDQINAFEEYKEYLIKLKQKRWEVILTSYIFITSPLTLPNPPVKQHIEIFLYEVDYECWLWKFI